MIGRDILLGILFAVMFTLAVLAVGNYFRGYVDHPVIVNYTGVKPR
jgi:hypothetical protein